MERYTPPTWRTTRVQPGSADVSEFLPAPATTSISGSTPLTGKPWGLSNLMTSKALNAIGSVGGPRCCKRDSYLSILSAIDFAKEHFSIEMEKSEIVCDFSSKNNQCLGKQCPFSE